MLPQFRNVKIYALLIALLCGCSMASTDDVQEKVEPLLPPASSLNGPAEGIYWMVNLPADNDYKSDIKAVLKENHCLNGIFIRINWDRIERAEGQYDWSQLDWAVERANKHNLQYKVMLLPGMHTPDWVYRNGAQAFKTTMPWPLRRDYGQPAKIPLPWDQVYQDYYKRIMQKMADRYKDDEYFVAATLTGANFVYGEMHLPKTDSDIQQWKTYGNYQKRIENVYKDLIDFYAKNFPHQQFVLHITIPIRGMQNNVKDIIEYGTRKYPERFTLQNAQLTGHQNNQNMFSYRMIMESRPGTHVGFQSLNSFVRFRERTGSQVVATYNFVKAGGQYWELLKPDGRSTEFTCQLVDLVEKARSMGVEAFKKELKEKGEFTDEFAKKRNLMEKYIKQGKYDEALKILDETFRFIKFDITKKVELLQKAGRTQDAIDFLKSVIDRRNTAAFHEMLASVYASASQYHKAAGSYEQAFQMSGNSKYLLQKAMLYAKNDFKNEAISACERFIESEEYAEDAYERVAQFYERYGYDDALEELKTEAAERGYQI